MKNLIFSFVYISALCQMGVSLLGISELVSYFYKFPPACQKGVYVEAFKAVLMLYTGADERQIRNFYFFTECLF